MELKDGTFARKALQGHAFRQIVVCRSRAMGVDVVHFLRRQSAPFQGLSHGAHSPGPLGGRGRLVEGLVQVRISPQFGQGPFPGPPQGRARFKNEIGRPFSQVESPPVFIEGPA